MEVRFEFSDEIGAHHAEKLGVAESENPLISAHSVDVVVSTSRAWQFRRRTQTGPAVVLSTTELHFSREKSHFFGDTARLERVSRAAGDVRESFDSSESVSPNVDTFHSTVAQSSASCAKVPAHPHALR